MEGINIKSRTEELALKISDITKDIEFVGKLEPLDNFLADFNRIYEKWKGAERISNEFDNEKRRDSLLNFLKDELHHLEIELEQNEK